MNPQNQEHPEALFIVEIFTQSAGRLFLSLTLFLITQPIFPSSPMA